MIYLTVGTQLAFDRLVRIVDEWSVRTQVRVVAQVGPSAYTPQRLEATAFLDPVRADQMVIDAELVVAHAGMGTVLTSLQHGKPVVIFPRLSALGEHRSDHQVATAKALQGRSGVHVAWSEEELIKLLDRRASLAFGSGIAGVASGPLVERLGAFLRGD